MEKMDALKPDDRVTVIIYGPDDKILYKSTGSCYHNLETAIRYTVEKGNLDVNPEDCVFEVVNETKDVSHKYRLNAHGHIKLII